MLFLMLEYERDDTTNDKNIKRITDGQNVPESVLLLSLIFLAGHFQGACIQPGVRS